MEYLIAAQDVLVAAAADLEGIGSALAAANRAAEAPTTGLLAAGADEVSAAIASLFSGNAQAYQALSAQAAAFHQQFVRALSSAPARMRRPRPPMPPRCKRCWMWSMGPPSCCWGAR